jgi:hypothetical protein
MRRTAKLRALALTGAVFAVAACAQTGGTEGQTYAGFVAKPDTIMVSQLDFADEIVVLDRALMERLRRDMKGKSAAAIKAEAAQRVGTVIAETAIAALRAAGLKASPGSLDIALGDEPTLVITGRVRGPDKHKSVGFGGTKAQVVADVQLTHLSWVGRRNVHNFTTAPASGAKPAAGEKLPPRVAGAEKLAPDVERLAQRIGGDVAAKTISYATKQGWLFAPGSLASGQPSQESGSGGPGTPGRP